MRINAIKKVVSEDKLNNSVEYYKTLLGTDPYLFMNIKTLNELKILACLEFSLSTDMMYARDITAYLSNYDYSYAHWKECKVFLDNKLKDGEVDLR